MGHPRKARKKYDTPPHPWNAERIKTDKKVYDIFIGSVIWIIINNL